MQPDVRVLLIGGTSHTGKSTLAGSLAERLAADVLATDYLAHHPGRPWSAPAERSSYVIAHYRDLSVPQLMQSALAHHERFLNRAIAFDRWIAAEVARLGLPSIKVDGVTGVGLQDLVMAQARPLTG
jgi:hypothetical protein